MLWWMFINIQIPVIPLSITGNHFRYAATIEPSNPFSRIWSRKRVMEQWRSKRLVEMHADIDKYFRLLSYRVVCVSFNKEQKKYLGAKEIQSGWYGVMCPLHRPLQVRQWAVWPYSQARYLKKFISDKFIIQADFCHQNEGGGAETD